MSTAFRRLVVTAVCLGMFGVVSWTIYEGVSSKTATVSKGCDGQPMGTVRVDKNGNPQICLKR